MPRNTSPPPYKPPTKTSTISSHAPAPNEEPPSYNKRTPSQEAAYMADLKAWAADKEKMYEGAYGEYFGTSVNEAHVPRWRYDQWHLEGGRTELSDASQSRADKDRMTDRELEQFGTAPATRRAFWKPNSQSHDEGKVGEEMDAASSGKGKSKEGFMAKLGRKMGLHEIGTEPGDNEEQGDPMRILLSGGMIVEGPSDNTKKRLEAEKAAAENKDGE